MATHCAPARPGYATRTFTKFGACHVFDVVYDALHLCRRVGSTNHESVGRCGDDRGQISHNDVATFFILDSFDDDVDEIF